MVAKTLSATFRARVHKTQVRFRIPQLVSDSLGLHDKVTVGLVIQDDSHETRFVGEIQAKSGLEVYGSMLEGRLEKGEPIVVQIFLLPARFRK